MMGSSVFWATSMMAQATPGTAAPAAAPATDTQKDEDVVYLSPFEVTSDTDTGYSSTETLAGTRLRTNLRDVATSISVVNSQFLKDTGVTDNQSLLVYTTNTQVGGVYGNFAGTGGASTYNETGNLLKPSSNTRVRGLDSADNTFNYFMSDVPWDGYNVDRIELLRGANSILFGVGSPAGIINANTKGAVFKNQGTVEARIGSYGSVRGTIDVNRQIIDDQLSIRVIALHDDTQYQQKPAYQKDDRVYLAVRYDPKLFGEASNTSIRVNFESGDIKANRPRTLPPIDAITPWFKTGSSNGYANLNKLTLDPNTTYNTWINNPATYGSVGNVYPWFHEAFLGRIMSSNVANFYDANSSTAMNSMMGMLGTAKGLDSTGKVDGTISGIEFARLYGIATYSAYAKAVVKGGNYYSNYSLTDTSIYDFYNKLIDGNNKKEWNKWKTANASLTQSFLHNRVGFEIAAYYENYEDGQYSFLSGDQYSISVDLNTKLSDGTANPNVGRPYVANSGYYGNYANYNDRASVRATAYVDLRATDYIQESVLTHILGNATITGLVAQDELKQDSRSFERWALGTDYTDATGATASLTGGLRTYDWVAYIGPSLLSSSYTSASGTHLSNVTGTIAPGKTVTARYFDSTWNATGVAYNADYTYYSHNADGTIKTNNGTQADNPANYVGWTTKTFSVLSAENGDINSLYYNITKSKTVIDSVGATVQSHTFDDNVVVTYGWRKDRVKNLTGQAPTLANDIADVGYKLAENDGISKANYADGTSRTWGIVGKSPDFINRHLPLGIQLSAFYGQGENFKADKPRGDVFGNQIDNPKGNTKEYGFVVSILDNRLSLKTTWYKTKDTNATLTEDSAGFSSSLYYVWALPYWGATHALAGLDGIADPQRNQGNWGWPWNSYVSATGSDSSGNPYFDANSNITTAGREATFAIIKDFFTNIPVSQKFSDEYGLNMNIAAMHAAGAAATFSDESTWDAMYAAVPKYAGAGAGLGLQPAYGGNLKDFGAGPVASDDTTSKGIEWELNGRITDNWNVTLNVSKTKATMTSVSPTIATWINSYTAFLSGAAGQLRLWGGDTFQTDWKNDILAPYATLLAKIGSSSSEVAPWAANLVTGYNFSEGLLKGVNVGIGERWSDSRILGYQYDASTDALDITKPWKAGAETHLDLWVGYTHQLTDQVNWKIQVNLRNVGERAHLVPVYIQPDGTTGYSRIEDGLAWYVTNTFEF
jgi:hypothetical protein